jgi:SAM-dependent methyltransferase
MFAQALAAAHHAASAHRACSGEGSMTLMPDHADDLYAPIARWYDLEHDTFTDDVRFYLDLAAGTGPLVLEIGCGSGRVTAPLARAGSQVTGVDASASMLAACRARVDRLPPRVAQRVRLVHADAGALGDEAPGPFSLALMPLNTLAHFATVADRLAVLTAVRTRLAPGARFALDVDLEGPRRLLAALGQLWHMGTWEVPASDQQDGETVMVTHLATASRAAKGEGLTVTHFYDALDTRGTVRRSLARMPLAVLTRDEVQLTLEHVGFIVEDVYGSYELDPYESGAERAIFVAHSQPATG